MNKYKTIIQDILSGIEKGDFKRGQRLPSIRKLSEKYQDAARDTVQKAMLELKYQNAIYAVEKVATISWRTRIFRRRNLTSTLLISNSSPTKIFGFASMRAWLAVKITSSTTTTSKKAWRTLIASSHQLLMDYDVYCRRDQLVIWQVPSRPSISSLRWILAARTT